MKLLRFWPVIALVVLLMLAILLTPIVYMSGSRTFEQLVIPADGYEIVGYLSEGTSSNGPWVIFGHGNRGNGQDHELYQRLMNNMHPEATILGIDFRGFGKSSASGLELADNIWNRSGDFNAAIAFLKKTYHASDDQIILIGHSLGAAQAIKAAQSVQYRLAIPIGLGDYDVVLTNQNSIREYTEKLSNNTGVIIDPEVILQEGEQMRPFALFSPCPKTPVVLIFGARDDGNSLMYSDHKVPDDCKPPIHWRTIPIANHMYGTEGGNFPRVLAKYYSMVAMSLLTRTINSLLTE